MVEQHSVNKSKSNIDCECLIVGGGLAGLTMAVALGKLGISAMIIDGGDFQQLQKASEDRRTTAISSATKILFENIGIWNLEKLGGTTIDDIYVCREGSRASIHYDHQEVGNEPLGYIVRNHLLKAELYKKLKQFKQITCVDQVKLEALEEKEDYIEALLTAQKRVKARLVIAADGRYSICRKLMGISSHEWSYRQETITGVISHEKPHEQIALEYFAPAGPFALLPMTGNEMCFVYCDSPEKIKFYHQPKNRSYFKEQLEARCFDFLGHIEFANEPQAFELKLMEAHKLYKGRVVLIGETAHVMHPVAGQGFNVSARDVAVLSELIEIQKQHGLDLGSEEMLKQYSQWRKFDITQLLAVTDSLIRLCSTNNIFLNLAQDIGFFAVSKISFLRQFFMKDAMGVTGDLPKLLQKENWAA